MIKVLELHGQIFKGVYEQFKCAQHELGGTFGTSLICSNEVKGSEPQTKP
jgi:hypothetical protein